ncbi:MAG: hypothetical protein IJT73_05890, partial [Selenomonadaceae bacterium]|nr:hypothetical protein [Selenomonadaceae bacterium]
IIKLLKWRAVLPNNFLSKFCVRFYRKKFGDKFPIGLFYKAESETYDVAYHKIIEMAGGTAK